MTDNRITLTDDVDLMARRLRAKARELRVNKPLCDWDSAFVTEKAKWRALALVAMGREE